MLEILVFLLPLIFITVKSFYDWQPGASSPFVGFSNYSTLFGQSAFWQVVRNQLFYLLGVPLWVVAPRSVALEKETAPLTVRPRDKPYQDTENCAAQMPRE